MQRHTDQWHHGVCAVIQLTTFTDHACAVLVIVRFPTLVPIWWL
jgi:hypothetical protein